MKHLTTVDKVKEDGRFSTSSHIDDSRFEKAIADSEQLYIKNQIGDSLFLNVVEYVNADDKTDYPDYSILLNGGIYEGNNGKKSFVGLIETLNCYIYANLIKTNSFHLTRFGFMNKQDDYSDHVSVKDRIVQENHHLSIADSYLKDCILYLRANKDTFPKFNRGKQRNRIVTRIIGD